MNREHARGLLRLAAGLPGRASDISSALEAFAALGHPPLQQLLPAIVHNARAGGAWSLLPDAAGDKLNRLSRTLIAKDVVQRQWLDSFLTEQLNRDIPVVLLKGAAFYGALYSRDVPRPSADLDILVRPGDFGTVCDKLEELDGLLKNDPLRPWTTRTLFEAVYEMPSVRPVIFEVHKALTKPYLFDIDEDGLWERRVEVPEYAAGNISMLSPEDSLLHLAVHGFLHAAIPAHALLDSHRILHRWAVDEDVLVARARRWGAATMLFALLRRVQLVFDDAAAERIAGRLAPSGHRRVAVDRLLPVESFAADAPRTRGRQAASLTLLDGMIRPALFTVYYAGLRGADLACTLFNRPISSCKLA